MRPEHFAALGIEPGHRVRMPDDQLPFAPNIVNHRRRITNFADRKRAPKLLATLFVERHHGAIAAPHGADEASAVEQRMGSVSPDGRLGCELLQKMPFPDELSVAGIEAEKIPHRAEGEEPSL